MRSLCFDLLILVKMTNKPNIDVLLARSYYFGLNLVDLHTISEINNRYVF